MKSVSKLRILAFCLLLISPFIISAEDNVSYWLNTQVEVGIIDRLKFKGEQALWYDDDRFTLTETLLLMEADVFDWLSIGVGDRLADERKRKDDKMQWVHEHRPTLDITFKHSYEGFKFDFRNRFEYRDKEGDKKKPSSLSRQS